MSMRETINAVNVLLEMPGLLSGPENFGLDTPKTNLQKAAFFNLPNATVLHEDDRGVLAILGVDEGAVGLVSKIDRKLWYYVRYESMSLPATGKTVTQVALWRKIGVERFYPHVTSFVFFDVLLKKFPAIMSDSLQTSDGRNFWLRSISEADRLGLVIEFADLGTEDVRAYDAEQFPDIGDWLADVDAWGPASTHKMKRLIIRNP